jgi:palmitoyl-protein thioesterase
VSRNATYVQNLSKLENLVLVLFSEDKTVVPKESSWFGSEEVPSALYAKEQEPFSASQPRTLISMRNQPLYIEDWIG